MGCDIHMWLEYAPYGDGIDGDLSWYSFVEDFNPGRDYHMFNIMAECGRNDGEVTQLYANRGLPEGKLSWNAKENLVDNDSDLHGHSWLTYSEFAHCMGERLLTNEFGPPDHPWRVLLVAMKEFEDSNIPTRLVFAFDN